MTLPDRHSTTGDLTADVAIVGAGIVGLATAMQLLSRQPGTRVVVVDKESRIAAHQTSHNSGVIHRGVYYTPGSLKARMCGEGARRLIDFCAARDIPTRLIGKLIIASDEDELPALAELHQRAVANGVPGVELLGAEAIPLYEPAAIGAGAVYSPETGIVDFGAVAQAYADEVVRSGGSIVLDSVVSRIRKDRDHVVLEAGSRRVRAAMVVTCGGLQSDRLTAMSTLAQEPARVRVIPFRGDYYKLRQESGIDIRGLIYPVPDSRFPFLGVHFTPRPNGEIWLGPNAVLAFAREGYGRSAFSLRDSVATLTYPGFWWLARRYWRTGAAEVWRDVSRRSFASALRRYVPAVKDEDLVGFAAGVRAQAVTEDGSLVDDFDIVGDDRLMHVRNAPSPAATSSLAIGDFLVDRLVERLEGSIGESGSAVV